MFDTICSLPLPSDLFAQAIHPTAPLLAVGLSAGHVQAYKLPPTAESSGTDSSSPEPQQPGSSNSLKRRRRSSIASENGLGEIATAWSTRRHKGSCRCLGFSVDGSQLYSAGTDGLVKIASSEDGRVVQKIAIPRKERELDAPSLLHVLTPQTLMLSTDSSALYLYDIREPTSASSRPSLTTHPHDDYISSLTPLPAPSATPSSLPKQFLTTGGTTIAITDIRKGVLSRSSDQEEELTSSVYVSGLKRGGSSQGAKVLVGGASGVLTLWEDGVWDDQDERIVVDRGGETVESLAWLPEEAGGVGAYQGQQKVVAAGLGDGRIRFVKLGANRVLADIDLQHDDVEGVMGLGFDSAGRMISGGGRVVKIWREAPGLAGGGEGRMNGAGRHGSEEDSDESGEEGGEESTSEEETVKTKRKKRKRDRGKDRSGGQHVMAFDLD